MSPYLPNGEWDGTDFSVAVHQWCPKCDPDGERVWDPWEMRYCDPHRGDLAGRLDHVAGPTEYLAQGEAGGDANIRMCNILHGRTP